MHILSLQPYFGGSHRAFQQGWQRHSRHRWTLLTLPPRHWKWRMRHAAVHFAESLRCDLAEVSFDAIVCSDFLNVAEFRGLVNRKLQRVPLVVYFHENQFAYPTRRYDERDLHFGFSNFTSCLAADQVWFNSAFNQDSFFDGFRRAATKWPDFVPWDQIDSIRTKCRIEPPGIEQPPVERSESRRQPEGEDQQKTLHLIWAARWEHDKNPARLLEGLRQFRSRQLDFRLSVIGQQFRRVPEVFDTIYSEFSDCIDCWGHLESRREYWQALADADVFISTANHEFFGIAAAEAIAAGAHPLLPDRLAYPELIRLHDDSQRQWFLYDGTTESLAEKLEYISDHRNTQPIIDARNQLQSDLVQRLNWPVRARQMDRLLEEIASWRPLNP